MAQLYFKYGAMGSSKTANALITKFNYEERGMRVWLIKPALDTRDGVDVVYSRVGLQATADVIEQETDIFALFTAEHRDCHAVIADECQFFTEAQIDQLRCIVDKLDIPVLCFGYAAALLQRDLYDKMRKSHFALFAAGTINIFTAGLLKAVWKLLYAANICDFVALEEMFMPVNSLGLLFVGLSLIGMLCWKKKSGMLSVAPPVFASSMPFIMMMVVGLGGMGTWHLNELQTMSEPEVAGIWDIKESRREYAASRNVHVYSGLEELLADETVDMVLIATPNDMHKPLAIAAMEAGKNIITSNKKKEGTEISNFLQLIFVSYISIHLS